MLLQMSAGDGQQPHVGQLEELPILATWHLPVKQPSPLLKRLPKGPTVAAHVCDTKQTNNSMGLFTHDPRAEKKTAVFPMQILINTPTPVGKKKKKREENTGIYRCRLCLVCELVFEPHDLLHHISPAGHHGDSRATVRTHRGARAP